MVLSNTFHLWLRPGLEVSEKFGGLAQDLTVNMHEVIGHASGRFSERLAGKPQDVLKEQYSALEEARAEPQDDHDTPEQRDDEEPHEDGPPARGAEGGGMVTNLPTHVFTSDDGDMDAKCPTEIGITDRREAELSNNGFLPLCHYKNTDYSVFFGAQTTQKPKKYDRPDATANAAISARLPYIMATSRFAHFLKVMARDKIGSFMEATDTEQWLNRWIQNYVNPIEGAGQESRAKYPLREARVEVKEIPGRPGSYNAVAYMRPWLQMEELTTSMRMVARIPEKA
jgi:hypothetical protein